MCKWRAVIGVTISHWEDGRKAHHEDSKTEARTRRDPLPFLVNAQQTANGSWQLPLPLDTLLFWAEQRWEIEVCHRERKSNFGLGNKQCFNPHAAVASVQWSARVYALLLLAGYRTFGLTHAPTLPAGGTAHHAGRSTRSGGRTALPSDSTTFCSPTPPE